MTRLHRRAFLAALGAGGIVSAQSLEGRGSSEVGGRSKMSGRPLRFVAVYTPHGRAYELMRPRDGFDIAFPESILQPFDDPKTYGASFKDRLLLLDGIDLTAGIAVGTTGHDGPRVILTGSGADGKNASVDQYLAVTRGLGAETAHTSLVLGVGHEQPEHKTSISYGPGGTPLPKWIDPAHTFGELFGAPLTGQRREEMQHHRRIGKSVLDVVRRDLSRFEARSPAAERTKFEQHQAALRDIEKRLSAAPPRCPSPLAPDRTRFPKLRAFGGGEPYFDIVTDLQIDLLARALACDITRFATLFLADLTRTKVDHELPDDVHSDVAHRYDARTDKHPGTPATWSALARQNRYSYGKVARLLMQLDRAGVLDDTLVFVCGDMGDPARHSSRNVPALIAGGAGGHFRMGRYLDLGKGPAAGETSASSGVPNNRLLVSICQAFGVETNRFGHAADSKIVTGRLAELHV